MSRGKFFAVSVFFFTGQQYRANMRFRTSNSIVGSGEIRLDNSFFVIFYLDENVDKYPRSHKKKKKVDLYTNIYLTKTMKRTIVLFVFHSRKYQMPKKCTRMFYL